MVSYNNKLWMFGGFGDSKGRFNDLRCYDPATKKWALIPNKGNFPKPIYLHTAVIYENKMWVFGGSTGKDTNDFYSFDFATSEWSKIETSGPIPSARYGHAACVCNGRMYIVGGCKQNSVYFQDSHSYDFVTKKWRSYGDVPQDLAYHSLTTYNNRVFLYGGYNGKKFCENLYVLDQDTSSWQVVRCAGKEPAHRCGCATVVVDKFLYVFGGYTQTGHTNELYRLDMAEHRWETMQTVEKPLSRAYLQACLIQGGMFLFGGYDGTKCVTDFRSIQLADEPVNMAKVLLEENVTSQVAYALKHFAKRQDLTLDAKDLETLFSNLAQHLAPAARVKYGGSGGPGSPPASPTYPFDTQHLQNARSLGFSHDQVIAALTALHTEGQNTSNFNLLLDRLMLAPSEKVEPSELARQTSEKTHLKQELDKLIEEKEDLRQCVICCERLMNCVLLKCSHLCACEQCAMDLKSKELPCPICRKQITGNFKVYWT